MIKKSPFWQRKQSATNGKIIKLNQPRAVSAHGHEKNLRKTLGILGTGKSSHGGARSRVGVKCKRYRAAAVIFLNGTREFSPVKHKHTHQTLKWILGRLLSQ
jgi:hypothetical protein